jgi:hypothetical protein
VALRLQQRQPLDRVAGHVLGHEVLDRHPAEQDVDVPVACVPRIA